MLYGLRRPPREMRSDIPAVSSPDWNRRHTRTKLLHLEDQRQAEYHHLTRMASWQESFSDLTWLGCFRFSLSLGKGKSLDQSHLGIVKVLSWMPWDGLVRGYELKSHVLITISLTALPRLVYCPWMELWNRNCVMIHDTCTGLSKVSLFRRTVRRRKLGLERRSWTGQEA